MIPGFCDRKEAEAVMADIEEVLREELKKIRPVSRERKMQAKAVWDGIFKPIDGLGRLEDIICDIAAVQDTTEVSIDKRAVLVMCSDNGIVEEGISQSTSEITAAVARNMAAGKASINRMAECCHTAVLPVDIGIRGRAEGCLERKIAEGTGNFAREAAMSREEALEAVLTGINLVLECKKRGYQLLGTGEMGIGNTTTTSALTSLLLKADPWTVTGRGAGLSDAGLDRKCRVIEKALVFHFGTEYLHRDIDVVTMLALVGGLDIAGLTGIFLGGGICRIPVIIDGVISACAAVLAKRLCPYASQYMIASHLGREPAHARLLEELGLVPVIHGDLALGEGTGAVLLIPMLDMALKVYENKETFEENHVEAYRRF